MSVWSSEGYHAMETKSAHGTPEKTAQLDGRVASFVVVERTSMMKLSLTAEEFRINVGLEGANKDEDEDEEEEDEDEDEEEDEEDEDEAIL